MGSTALSCSPAPGDQSAPNQQHPRAGGHLVEFQNSQGTKTLPGGTRRAPKGRAEARLEGGQGQASPWQELCVPCVCPVCALARVTTAAAAGVAPSLLQSSAKARAPTAETGGEAGKCSWDTLLPSQCLWEVWGWLSPMSLLTSAPPSSCSTSAPAGSSLVTLSPSQAIRSPHGRFSAGRAAWGCCPRLGIAGHSSLQVLGASIPHSLGTASSTCSVPRHGLSRAALCQSPALCLLS